MQRLDMRDAGAFDLVTGTLLGPVGAGPDVDLMGSRLPTTRADALKPDYLSCVPWQGSALNLDAVGRESLVHDVLLLC